MRPEGSSELMDQMVGEAFGAQGIGKSLPLFYRAVDHLVQWTSSDGGGGLCYGRGCGSGYGNRLWRLGGSLPDWKEKGNDEGRAKEESCERKPHPDSTGALGHGSLPFQESVNIPSRLEISQNPLPLVPAYIK
jgi:hypothetical protein